MEARADKIAWGTSVPFFLTHVLAVTLPFVVGISWELVAVAALSYAVRMFGITAGYHRYFSHRSFKAGRVMQLALAFLAQTSAQKGALWWAAHHRHHHRVSDEADNLHSPLQKGFWWSHLGWILSDKYEATNEAAIRDFARFSELRWLNRFHLVPFLVMMVGLALAGGLPYVVWGGLVATVLLWHGTFTINSLSHVFGRRRYLTKDTSRNNWLLALVTMGEGWHNNHHFHQNTANQGWFWWEVDVTFVILRVLERLRLVSGLRVASEQTMNAHLAYTDAQRALLEEQSRPLRRAPRPAALPPKASSPVTVVPLRSMPAVK